MIVYVYGEMNDFLYEHDCEPNQRRPGEFFIPENSTNNEPPDYKSYEIPVWDGSKWSIKKDYRHIPIWNMDAEQIKNIDYLGEPSVKFTTIEPKCEHPIWDGKSWIVNEEKKKETESALEKEIRLSVLMQLDIAAMRPLLAIQSGTATEEDYDKLRKVKKSILEERSKL